ncbi:hypothetical protein PAECIP111893_02872 [Paenibacillus plantiphilus]|uniref:DUF2249 domain-containing protein n=1 Tax=Paenibacillus plantiphilus TaxID=2905650 RepID=A0ABM9CC06_9BACL|nr:DUF2249 domain-containing protein [Paenibacillus plantiphilus]CAH1208702.1 hypothetical protein PAECIP111893_02872 [Paenibacillus plantiphilus]
MERQHAKIIELDVRPHLRNKLEPFQLIMETVKKLEADDIFVLHATFKPSPLLGMLKLRGFAGQSVQSGKEHWITTFVSKKNKRWLHETVDDDTWSDAPVEASAEEASSEEDASSDISTTATANTSPLLIELDNRGLEPPQPMIRTLAALERIHPEGEVVIHNDRVPVFLIEELNSLGCAYSVEEQPDGTAKVSIRKKT